MGQEEGGGRVAVRSSERRTTAPDMRRTRNSSERKRKITLRTITALRPLITAIESVGEWEGQGRKKRQGE